MAAVMNRQQRSEHKRTSATSSIITKRRNAVDYSLLPRHRAEQAAPNGHRTSGIGLFGIASGFTESIQTPAWLKQHKKQESQGARKQNRLIRLIPLPPHTTFLLALSIAYEPSNTSVFFTQRPSLPRTHPSDAATATATVAPPRHNPVSQRVHVLRDSRPAGNTRCPSPTSIRSAYIWCPRLSSSIRRSSTRTKRKLCRSSFG